MALLPFLGSALGGIASAVGNAVTAGRENRNIKEFNDFQSKMAQYSYNKDLENWNRTNEYNSPKAQMERFRQAGLNPALMYSRGNAGTAGEIPRYQAPQANFNFRPYLNLPDTLSKYQQFQSNRAGLETQSTRNQILQKQLSKEGLTLADLENTFLANWGEGVGPMKSTKYNIIKRGLDIINNKWDIGKSTLENIQAAIALRKQQQALNAFELAFQDAGGKFFGPATGGVNTLINALKLWLLKK